MNFQITHVSKKNVAAELRVKEIKNLTLSLEKFSKSSIKCKHFRATASEHNSSTHIRAVTEIIGPILENLTARKLLQIG